MINKHRISFFTRAFISVFPELEKLYRNISFERNALASAFRKIFTPVWVVWKCSKSLWWVGHGPITFSLQLELCWVEFGCDKNLSFGSDNIISGKSCLYQA